MASTPMARQTDDTERNMMTPDYRSYFQLRVLPCARYAMVVSIRRARVSSRLASVTYSTYSRLWLGGNALNVASALAFLRSAAVKYAGTFTGGFFVRFRSTLRPLSFNSTAARTVLMRLARDGRSASDRILP